MTPQEEKQIKEWNDKRDKNVQIHLILTEDERSKTLVGFCETLSEVAPNLLVKKEKQDISGPPSIRVGRSLYYQAVPLGTELAPFLDALDMPDKGNNDISPQIREYLDKVDMPAVLRIYVSPQCPFCPGAVRSLLPLPVENELINLTVIDGFLFPEMAHKDNIQAAPTILLDDSFRWTGSAELEEVLEMMTNRDPSALTKSSLERMLTEGNAGLLAEMMIKKGMIFPAFIELLIHPHFTLRLGAMVVIEDIAEQNITLAGQVTEPLWEYFQDQDDQVKGDILHIIGEAGGPENLPRLKRIAQAHDNPEIREAAEDAIEKTEERS